MARIHPTLSTFFQQIHYLPRRRDHGHNLCTEVTQASPTSSDEFKGIGVPLNSEQTFDIRRAKRDGLLFRYSSPSFDCGLSKMGNQSDTARER